MFFSRLVNRLKRAAPEPLLSALDAMPRKYERYQFGSSEASVIKSEIAASYGFQGEMLDIYASVSGALVHKWHHYIPLYDRYFSSFRNSPVRLLEIGVSGGGSLCMWRRYFGDQATIYGIDVNPDCERFDGQFGRVRIGSQADHGFLEAVIDEMGGVDIVIDDGSHRMDHIESSFFFLFPLLSRRGIYLIEDLHTSYWRGWGGGYRSSGNFLHRIHDFIDSMHHWYHGRSVPYPMIASSCTGIHIHDSLVVFDKGAVHPPRHSSIQ